MATITTVARIDEEINKHLLSVSDLLAQRNSFLPIFRLSPEILANIFTHGARNYYHESIDHTSFRIPRWVDVSYVCRHWRDVALNCPILWTYHFTVSLRWTEELLARSKQASLKIRIHYDSHKTNSWWSDIMEKLLNHAERTQELSLDVPDTILPIKFSLYAPRLQILDICTLDHPSEWLSVINYGDMNIPPLRTLKLTDCPLQWHSLNLSRVTTLVLSRVPVPSQQNIVEFLATLSRMQALTVLHLEHALASALSSGSFSVFPKVGLPYLARLFVVAPLSTVVALLSCINIPLKTRVRLEIVLDGSSVDDYSQLPTVLAQRFSQSEDLSSRPTIRSLVVHFLPDKQTFSLIASKCNRCGPLLSMAYPPRECNAPLMIHVGMKQSMLISDKDRIISDICCSVPSTHVRTLRVINPLKSPYFWRNTLGHLSGLQYKQLSDGPMPDLVSLLALVADKPLVVPKGHVNSGRGLVRDSKFLPTLERLDLYRIRFRFTDEDGISQKLLLDTLFSDRLCRHLRLTMIDCTRGEEPNLINFDYFDPIDYIV